METTYWKQQWHRGDRNEGSENGASMEIMALKGEVNDMRLDLDNLHEQKIKFELSNEQNQKEYADSLAKMQDLNTKLAAQIADKGSSTNHWPNKCGLKTNHNHVE